MSATSRHDQPLVERVRTCIASTLSIPAADVPDDVSIGRPALWDSVAHVALMCAIADEFEVQVPDDVVPALTSLPAIVDYVVTTVRPRH